MASQFFAGEHLASFKYFSININITWLSLCNNNNKVLHSIINSEGTCILTYHSSKVLYQLIIYNFHEFKYMTQLCVCVCFVLFGFFKTGFFCTNAQIALELKELFLPLPSKSWN